MSFTGFWPKLTVIEFSMTRPSSSPIPWVCDSQISKLLSPWFEGTTCGAIIWLNWNSLTSDSVSQSSWCFSEPFLLRTSNVTFFHLTHSVNSFAASHLFTKDSTNLSIPTAYILFWNIYTVFSCFKHFITLQSFRIHRSVIWFSNIWSSVRQLSSTVANSLIIYINTSSLSLERDICNILKFEMNQWAISIL